MRTVLVNFPITIRVINIPINPITYRTFPNETPAQMFHK